MSTPPPVLAAIAHDDHVAQAVAWLAAVDPHLARAAGHGLPPLRRRPGGLEGLAYLVTGQLISTRAAEAIWGRLAARLTPFEPTAVARLPVEALQASGLTRAKARTILGCAAAIADGRLDLDGLARLDDAAARARLMALPGIGGWTADLYLLACLGRPDVWPSGDLALRAGLGELFGLDARPDAREAERLAEPWRPLRAVAARLVWQAYAAARR